MKIFNFIYIFINTIYIINVIITDIINFIILLISLILLLLI